MFLNSPRFLRKSNHFLLALGILIFISRSFIILLTEKTYDLNNNLRGLHRWREGLPIYTWAHLPDPPPIFAGFIGSPFLVIIHAPLFHLSLSQAALVWRLTSLLLYGGTIWLLWASLPFPPKNKSLAVGLWVFLLLIWEPMYSSVATGQVDEIVVFCLAVGFYGLMHRRPTLTGISIGLAAAVKISPILLVVYGLLRREWKTVFVAGAGGLVLGISTCFLVSWGECSTFAFTMFPTISRGSTYFSNQSISGFLVRSMSSFDDWRSFYPVSANVRFINMGISLVLISLVLLALKHGRIVDDHPFAQALEYSMALVILLLISPICWYYYLTWLIIPLSTIISAASSLPRRESLRVFFFTLLACSLILLPDTVSYENGISIAQDHSVFVANLFVSTGLWGMVLLLLVLIFLYRKLNRTSGRFS